MLLREFNPPTLSVEVVFFFFLHLNYLTYLDFRVAVYETSVCQFHKFYKTLFLKFIKINFFAFLTT